MNCCYNLGIITEYGVFKPDEIRQKVGEITKNMVPAPIQSTNELVINEHSFDHQFFYPKNDAQAILQNANEMVRTYFKQFFMFYQSLDWPLYFIFVFVCFLSFVLRIDAHTSLGIISH